jgi:hypothetical protein
MADLARLFELATQALWEWIFWVALFYVVLAVVVFVVTERD